MFVKDYKKCQCGYHMVPVGLSRKNSSVRLFCSQCGACEDIPFEKTEKTAFGLQDNGLIDFDANGKRIQCEFVDLPDFFLSDYVDGKIDFIDTKSFNECQKVLSIFDYFENVLSNEQQAVVLSEFDIPLIESFAKSLAVNYREGIAFGDYGSLSDFCEDLVNFINDEFDMELETSDIVPLEDI